MACLYHKAWHQIPKGPDSWWPLYPGLPGKIPALPWLPQVRAQMSLPLTQVTLGTRSKDWRTSLCPFGHLLSGGH